MSLLHIDINMDITNDRELIALLAQNSDSNYITVEKAAEVLSLTTNATAVKLASLTRRGWMLRAKRGIYLILPIEAVPGQLTTSEDPWILANKLFSPCYIGGWSAIEYWGLSEQIFNSTLVVTAANIRSKQYKVLNQNFRLFNTSASKLADLNKVWRGNLEVSVSSKERTIIDCLTFPELAGGVQHLAVVMANYANDSQHNYSDIISSAIKFGSGATWKRLGFLAEKLWPNQEEILIAAKKHMSKGDAKLDPSVKRNGELLNKWSLWINITIHLE